MATRATLLVEKMHEEKAQKKWHTHICNEKSKVERENKKLKEEAVENAAKAKRLDAVIAEVEQVIKQTDIKSYVLATTAHKYREEGLYSQAKKILKLAKGS